MLRAGVFFGLFVGVVARADHGATFDDAEADLEAKLFPVLKFIGVHPAVDFPVLWGRLQILADGEDIDLIIHQVAKGLFDLFPPRPNMMPVLVVKPRDLAWRSTERERS